MELDAAAITQHVDEALRSPLFLKAERQARFLRYVVAAALQSPAPPVREFDIARAVYDRRDDYDPRIDPIVRVEAARLRARLREYYEVSPPARVRIELPKGRYLPEFTLVGSVRAGVPAPATILLVLPLKPLSPDVEDAVFCDGLADELVHRLTRVPGLRIVGPTVPPAGAAPWATPGVRLEASVRRIGVNVRVTLRLVDAADGVTRLSTLYAVTLSDVFAAQEHLAQAMCDDVAAALRSPAAGESCR